MSTSPVLSDQSLRTSLGNIQDTLCYQLLNTGALAIGSGSKKKVKLVNTIYALMNGALIKKTSAEVALSGTVVNATYNVFVVTMDAAGTLTATMGTAGATLAAVVFPAIPASSVVLGWAEIHPTGTGNFVGATTDLDDGTVVPNAVYYNTPLPINWTMMENL